MYEFNQEKKEVRILSYGIELTKKELKQLKDGKALTFSIFKGVNKGEPFEVEVNLNLIEKP